MTAEPLAILLRFSLYGTLGLLFGLLAFRQYAAVPNTQGGHWRRYAVMSASGAVLSLVGLADLAARMHGIAFADVGSRELAMVLSLPGIGMSFIARIAFLLLATAFLLFRPGRGRISMAFSAAALISLAWQGHAGASEGSASLVHLVATTAHLVAAGIWLGALAMFMRLARQALRLSEPPTALSASLQRFHGVGTVVVITLVVTGGTALVLIAGWPLPPTAFQSLWWWLLATKLALFVAMLGLAGANRFRIGPRLAAGHEQATLWIRRSVVLELVLAMIILMLVAWLGLLAPDPN